MNSTTDLLIKQYGRVTSPKQNGSSDVFEPTLTHNYDEAKRLATLVDWINSIVPNVTLSAKASSEDLRACLVDGTVLLQILNWFKPGSAKEGIGSDNSKVSSSENVKKFLAAMDKMGISKFDVSDLEKGSINSVMDCLLSLRAQYFQTGDNLPAINTFNRIGSPHGDSSPHGNAFSPSTEEKRKMSYRNAVLSDPSAATMHHVGHKFHEVFQLKQGRYADLSAAKISEMMKSNSLDNAPTQSLLSVVNGILDESIERKNGEIPHRVACLLRKVVQEIERRISTQAEHLRTQNNLFKAREEKYQSRIRVLEALASGTGEENGIVMDQLQQIKMEKSKMEEKKKLGEEEALKLMKEKEQINLKLLALKQELEMEKKTNELRYLQMETEAKGAKAGLEEATKLIKEKEQANLELSTLKQELEMAKKAHELHCLQMEAEAKGTKAGLEGRLKDLEKLLEDSRNKVNILEANSESTRQKWSKKEHVFQKLLEFQFGALRELRLSSKSIENEVVRAKDSYSEEFNRLGIKLKEIIDSTENYHLVLAENRRMYNELQDLKGNIRVYCRIRPFLPGQSAKKTIIEHIGNEGELIVANPNKPGKDGQRTFRFNKVYGPNSTQVKVFSDTRPFIRSVLDGYNVCIFAYGQTGSGKTYTMTGPNGASEEEWGVNYRALNDLFNISQNRKGALEYEVGVQMVEIYNEQVRDLLSNNGPQKRLGILSASQSNGLAVPDASMNPVTSTSDVLELMEIGFKNRAMSATALNERSSRSHSVVSIHVRGKDLKNGTSLHGNLHLVDLAGSERVDRSEVTGDRLKEAQHINKSLSALGDVIFALAQKNAHVPYRNSKLTQLLQSSLGGQAKTLMFVQLNPDATSYSETMSTLKFAERVSGVELGAARNNKDGRDVRELMEQVASLKDTITKKDEEIERLQLLKDLKNVYPGLNGEKQATGAPKYARSSSSNDSVGSRGSQKSPARTGRLAEKAASDQDNNSEHSDRHSEGENMGYGDGDYEEKFSDMSDGALSAGTEHDGSVDEGSKLSERSEKSRMVSKIRSLQKPAQTTPTTKDSLKAPTGIRKTPSNSTLVKPPKRWT